MLEMRRIGNAKPLFVITAVMRSRDSLIVPSGKPTRVRCFQTTQLSPTAMGCSATPHLHLDGMDLHTQTVILPPQDTPSVVAEKVLASRGAEFPRGWQAMVGIIFIKGWRAVPSGVLG